MIVSNVVISFDMLERGMGLPEGVKIIAVRESEQGNHLVVRVLSENQPVDYLVGSEDAFSKLGEAFKPGTVSNYSNKGTDRGGPYEEDDEKDAKDFAEVDVIKAY
jgi:hypothetical protein